MFEAARLICSQSQRDVTPYRSPGCADVLRGERAEVTDFFLMTLVDTSVVKHNMLKHNGTRHTNFYLFIYCLFKDNLP